MTCISIIRLGPSESHYEGTWASFWFKGSSWQSRVCSRSLAADLGIADLALAGLIISGWPGTASWAIELIVGVNLFSSGLAITMAVLAGRRIGSDALRAAHS